MTNIADNYAPNAPTLQFDFESIDSNKLNGVILNWEKTVHNGKYHIYKMTNSGDWAKIAQVQSNDAICIYRFQEVI